jgi:hypothetical protein
MDTFCELSDVFRVAGPRGECLHREEMFWRSGEDTKARVVENPRCRRIPARRDIRTGLLIQPPAGQAQLGAYCPRFFKHNAIRLEQCINSRVARRES